MEFCQAAQLIKPVFWSMMEHDIILEADSKKITKDLPLSEIVQSHEVGDKLDLKILRRDGKELEATVTLEEMK